MVYINPFNEFNLIDEATITPLNESTWTNLSLNFDKFFLYSLIFYTLTILLFISFKRVLTWYPFLLMCIFNLVCINITLFILAYKCFINSEIFYLSTAPTTHLISLIDLSFNFIINPLSISFSLLVCFIGLSTNIYIINYFKNEADEMGFIFWINFFIISMVWLVLANNFFTLFLGWELIGLTSFFLINFWHARFGTLKSSFKAFGFNLVSDIFLLATLVILYQQTLTTDISLCLLKLTSLGVDNSSFYMAVTCLIICASIKSVQLFMHLWLPDSMEAPVPASALIHSATLVSAGVFLLLKFNILLILTGANTVVIYLGAITAAYGGVVAAAQTDMKKLLAYSTMSHCGFLYILVGFDNFLITIVYLYLHGIFKAATFFCVGSFIRFYNTQDTRHMGGGHRFLLLDTLLLILCAGNLAGLPLTIGSVYKFFFLSMVVQNKLTLLQLGLIFIGMLSSSVYFFRLIYYSCFDILKVKTTNLSLFFLNIFTKVKLFKSLVPYANIISATLILSFGIFIFFVIFFLTNIYVLELEVFTKKIADDSLIIEVASELYHQYFVIFYLLFLIIAFSLMVFTWRRNFFFFDKILSIVYFMLSLIAVVVTVNIGDIPFLVYLFN